MPTYSRNWGEDVSRGFERGADIGLSITNILDRKQIMRLKQQQMEIDNAKELQKGKKEQANIDALKNYFGGGGDLGDVGGQVQAGIAPEDINRLTLSAQRMRQIEQSRKWDDLIKQAELEDKQAKADKVLNRALFIDAIRGKEGINPEDPRVNEASKLAKDYLLNDPGNNPTAQKAMIKALTNLGVIEPVGTWMKPAYKMTETVPAPSVSAPIVEPVKTPEVLKETVLMTAPNGKQYKIPKDKIEEAKRKGLK